MSTFQRISARQGQTVDLDAAFYNGGVPADPFALYKIDIYKTQPIGVNLVVTVPIVGPGTTDYPYPVQTEPAPLGTVSNGFGTVRTITLESSLPYPVQHEHFAGTPTILDDTPATAPGKYHLIFDVPRDWAAPDVYFDVWSYYPIDPCTGTSSCDLDDPETQKQLLSVCHRFWLYPDDWFSGDGLQTVNFGFEPLSQRFHSPEIRPLEIGLMPLPLYEYDYNLVTPLIPFLKPSITISTMNCETLVENDAMSIGLRQGNYRSNPWVLKYLIETTKFLKGTYKYRVTLSLPDGTSRTSSDFIFTIR